MKAGWVGREGEGTGDGWMEGAGRRKDEEEGSVGDLVWV